ncbi:Response regulator receiver domain-containing protein [Marinobacter antarcticus]|uniref:Response regulator receiver domain-containing protein n=1 Tax=Marinobacter antarcticus TaxID=564117 RepID=A0A1M6QD33_9GAMM|nr:Response regulator receiver domain-containing protein [Marinobacter antarcticus]
MMPDNSLKRILMIEDEPDIRAVAELALEAIGGFELTACESGQQALEQIGECQPQLIVLDVMMPGMDGPATLKAIRRLPGHAATPAVFMTAKVQSDEVQGYLALGAVGVIPKPFDPLILADQIREIWNETCAIG